MVFWFVTPCSLVDANTLTADFLILTETSGRQQLCHQEDNRPGYAGHRPAYSECQPAEVRSTSWATTRVLYSHGVAYINLYSPAGM